MSETERLTLVGNLTADPELRYTTSGLPVTSLRVAVTPRTRQEDGTWTQGETSFHTINVWRDQAEHAVDSLTKGARVIIVGRPKERSWTDADGTDHQVAEVDAEEVGPSLRWATAKVTRTNGTSRSGKTSGQFNDAPSF
jgi:single-strand DNA-binding protein